MKINVNTMKQQTQDFFLRLFIESDAGTTPSSGTYPISSRCGTYARLHS